MSQLFLTSFTENGEAPSSSNQDNPAPSEESDSPEDASPTEEGAAGVINENLFEEDVDLDELEDELDDLSI